MPGGHKTVAQRVTASDGTLSNQVVARCVTCGEQALFNWQVTLPWTPMPGDAEWKAFTELWKRWAENHRSQFDGYRY
jgi:hypothetical protein